MHRMARRTLHDLLTARHTGCRNDRVRWCRRNSRKEAHGPDLERQIVVLTLEAERARHAAAPSVEHVDRRTRNAAQQRNASRRRTRCFLMAVAVKQNRPTT